MVWDLEMTDTYSGEANYSWVRQASVTDCGGDLTRMALVRRFKAALGITGVRGKSEFHGDFWEFRPYGACIVVFATYRY